jgi:hypothetical protein
VGDRLAGRAAGDVEERSQERLTKNHLHGLVRIAQDDLHGFFERNPLLKDYRSPDPGEVRYG